MKVENQWRKKVQSDLGFGFEDLQLMIVPSTSHALLIFMGLDMEGG